MNDSLQKLVDRFSLLLFTISLALIISGAAVLLYFGFTVYQLIEHPEKSQFFQYILTQLPIPTADIYTLKINDGGKVSEVAVPTTFMAYGRIIIAFIVWGILGGMAASLIRAGTTIFRVLVCKPADKKLITHE